MSLGSRLFILFFDLIKSRALFNEDYYILEHKLDFTGNLLYSSFRKYILFALCQSHLYAIW